MGGRGVGGIPETVRSGAPNIPLPSRVASVVWVKPEREGPLAAVVVRRSMRIGISRDQRESPPQQ